MTLCITMDAATAAKLTVSFDNGTTGQPDKFAIQPIVLADGLTYVLPPGLTVASSYAQELVTLKADSKVAVDVKALPTRDVLDVEFMQAAPI